jgi:hypothetical protein
LKDVQNEEALFQSKKKRKALRDAAKQEAAQTPEETSKSQATKQDVESVGGVKFY